MHTKSLLSVALLAAAGEAAAQTPDPFGPGTGASTVLPAVTVTAPRTLEAEPTNAASEKRLSGETLNTRPIERPGDLLEATPGLVVTQHSGEGKANQYFLRGMNLDHGTDLAIWLDGMPVNMRTHGHGQGYADINFLIPELVEQMIVKKGPYWAEEGDFASAGSLRLAYADRLERSVVLATGGSFGYWRGLAAGTLPFGSGSLTGAGEVVFYNGPWQIPDNLRKFNGFLRYSEGTPDNGLSITALGYTNSWHATDQIPARAVADGSLGLYGSVDPTDGGDTQRYSLSMNWRQSDARTASKVEAYAIYSTLNLYNNFTYFLDDPANGDQFQQSDKRKILGFNASHLLRHELLGFPSETTVGTQVRYDDIGVGLFNTFQRTPLSTVRYDQVSEVEHRPLRQQRDALDRLDAGDAGRARRSVHGVGRQQQRRELGLHLGLPGQSQARRRVRAVRQNRVLHQRGAGLSQQRRARRHHHGQSRPIPASRWPPCPCWCARGARKSGVRSQAWPGLDASLTLFMLDFDSELLFVGDAGTTEASRPSRRIGVEWTSTYRPRPWASVDLDLAYTRARFSDYSIAATRSRARRPSSPRAA